MEIDIWALILYIFLLTCISGIWCGSINRCIRSRYCIGETDVEIYEEPTGNNNNLEVVIERPVAMIYLDEYILQLNKEQKEELLNTVEESDIGGITLYQYYHVIGRALQIYFEEEKLEKLSYQSEENEFCSICQSEINNEKMCTRFPCNHFFHEDCIYHWFKHSGKCPLCMKFIYRR